MPKMRQDNSEHVPTVSPPLTVLTSKRISLAPPFPGLHHFKQGQNFQQWTGNDLKALIKVFRQPLTSLLPLGVDVCN